MAVAAWKICFKYCGYLCGTIAALNVWFFIGMTVFSALGNPYIEKEVLKYNKLSNDDAGRFTTVFAACILLQVLCFVGCCGCTKA
mmetsp:Transcript_7071/g.8164  ORF Transcript_7071/g.8164 Transcript_7071/m.8164 type:complete len:85 (+) Transcript_7071:1-255(+)